MPSDVGVDQKAPTRQASLHTLEHCHRRKPPAMLKPRCVAGRSRSARKRRKRTRLGAETRLSGEEGRQESEKRTGAGWACNHSQRGKPGPGAPDRNAEQRSRETTSSEENKRKMGLRSLNEGKRGPLFSPRTHLLQCLLVEHVDLDGLGYVLIGGDAHVQSLQNLLHNLHSERNRVAMSTCVESFDPFRAHEGTAKRTRKATTEETPSEPS